MRGRNRRIGALMLVAAAVGAACGLRPLGIASNDHRPVISPDGRTLAFMSDRDGTWAIYLMPLDGSAPPQRVSDDPRGEWYGSWSPDGSQLSYHRSDEGISFLRTYIVATGEERPLGAQDGNRSGVRWAPDGHAVLYVCRPRGICAMTPEGDELGIAYGLDGGQHDPALSPDGSWIAYVDPLEDDGQDAFIQRTDGSNRIGITDDPGRTYGLDWSPDGRYLSYNTELDGNGDIYVYEVATGKHRRLTTDPTYEHLPTWSPDGTFLVFTAEQPDGERIYRIAPDGTGLQMVDTRGGAR